MVEVQQPAATPGADSYAALVGVDWGDKEHAWTLEESAEAGGRRRQGKIEHSPETVDAWVAGLLKDYGNKPIAVAVEQKNGALVAMLSKYEAIDIYPVHPRMSAAYREMFHTSGSKNDALDGRELLDFLRKHPERLTRLEPDVAPARKLRQLVEQRRTLVDDRTGQSNRLTALLKMYYPQILTWWKDLDSQGVMEWLEHWPTLARLKKAKAAEVRRLMSKLGYEQDEMAARLKEIAAAVPAVTDAAMVESSELLILASVGLIQRYREAIAKHDREITATAKAHPDYALVKSLPGAGDALEPRLLAALGTRREQFASARDLQCATGIAPVLKQSGRTRSVHFRRACPKFVRQTFHEWAGCTIGRSAWATDYYQQQRKKGKKHHAAVRALAFKWQRILFRCWKDGVPYDESRYMKRLAERAVAPLLGKAKL